MDNTINWNKLLKQINILLMLGTMLVLGFTTMLFEAVETLEIDELDEIHEFCGFTFFGLLFIHLVLYRSRLKSYLTFKK